jgi:hypothetical protein
MQLKLCGCKDKDASGSLGLGEYRDIIGVVGLSVVCVILCRTKFEDATVHGFSFREPVRPLASCARKIRSSSKKFLAHPLFPPQRTFTKATVTSAQSPKSAPRLGR